MNFQGEGELLLDRMEAIEQLLGAGDGSGGALADFASKLQRRIVEGGGRDGAADESQAERTSCSLGRRSSADASIWTLSESSSSRSIPAKCSRSHATPVN